MGWSSDFISVDELCAALDIDRATLYRWRRKGIGPAEIKLGRQKVLFKREDVDKWLTERRAS